MEEMPRMSRNAFKKRETIIDRRRKEQPILFSKNDEPDLFSESDNSLFETSSSGGGGNKHPIVKALMMVCLLFITIGGALEYQKINSASSRVFAGKTHHINKRITQKKPMTVLAMGTDVGALNRGNSGGNTDSMELFTINPKKQSITMTSIPRDTLVRVNSKNGPDYVKLNAAYGLGGPQQSVKQVEELLDIHIDYYAVINMGVLQKVVDSVGGVTVDNPFAFDYEGHHFPQGSQHLNGKFALKYSRMRYDDPNNDYGRQKRQQQILSGIITNFKKNGSLTAVNQILDAVGDGVKTNVPINEVKPLYLNYRKAMNNVKTEHFQGQNAMIDGVSFQIASTNEINRVSKLIHEQLGLKFKPVHNHETRMFDSQPDYHGTNDSLFVLPGHAKYNHPGSGDGSDVVVSQQQKAKVESDALLVKDRDIFGK